MLDEIIKIGEGSMGGKSNNLLYATQYFNSMIKEGTLPQELTDTLKIPQAFGLTIQFYDDQVELLDNQTKEEITKANEGEPYDYLIIENGFLSAPKPDSLQEELRMIVNSIDGPLVTRSSSLEEDSKGAAFAGKHLSPFSGNQGDEQEKMNLIQTAVMIVYASTSSPDAIAYKLKMGLHDIDKMGLLIMKTVGDEYQGKFLPLVSGVVFTRNYFPWRKGISRDASHLRVVFGLGTRATDREYARHVSLSNIDDRPEGTEPADIKKYSQEGLDVIDLHKNVQTTIKVSDLIVDDKNHYPNADSLIRLFYDTGSKHGYVPAEYTWNFKNNKAIIYFDDFFKKSINGHPITKIFQSLSTEVKNILNGEVDYEFATDMKHIYLLQLRDLTQREELQPKPTPLYVQDHPEKFMLFEAERDIPNGHIDGIDHIIYVDMEKYRLLKTHEKYMVADEIGNINNGLGKRGSNFILIGPGRWGTNDPELGITTKYHQIMNTKALVEYGTGEFAPEVSYGSHMFIDLMEAKILHIPLLPEIYQTVFRKDFFTLNNGEDMIKTDNENIREAISIVDVKKATNTLANMALNGELEQEYGALYLKKPRGDVTYKTLDMLFSQ